jgi:hypothetical protein
MRYHRHRYNPIFQSLTHRLRLKEIPLTCHCRHSLGLFELQAPRNENHVLKMNSLGADGEPILQQSNLSSCATLHDGPVEDAAASIQDSFV